MGVDADVGGSGGGVDAVFESFLGCFCSVELFVVVLDLLSVGVEGCVGVEGVEGLGGEFFWVCGVGG